MKLLIGVALSAMLLASEPAQNSVRTVRTLSGGTQGGNEVTSQYLVALPHFAIGPAWTTTVLLRNESDAPADVTLLYFGDNGQPLSIPAGDSRTDQSVVTIASHGQVSIQMADAQADWTGWAALVYANSGVKAQGIFAWRNSSGGLSEAVAPVISQLGNCIIPLPKTGSTTMPYDNTGDAFSGYGFANPSGDSTLLRLEAFDENGALLGEYTQQLAGFGHTALLLTEKITLTEGRRGVLRISGGVVPLGFKFIEGGARFTTWQP